MRCESDEKHRKVACENDEFSQCHLHGMQFFKYKKKICNLLDNLISKMRKEKNLK